MRLFKSKLRKRIEDAIRELQKEIADIKEEKSRMKQTMKPSEYCKLIIRQGEMQSKINVLKSVL